MRCDDGGYYVVKFQNNPQHKRVLANEMLATRLAARLGLCVPGVEVVDVRAELIACTSDLSIQCRSCRIPCSSGEQFGSRFPGNPARLTTYDVFPESLIDMVRNLSDFLGAFVFDKWTCNTDRRQAIFFGLAKRQIRDFAGTTDGRRYQAMMIDQGSCFNAGEWNFPDAPTRSVYENLCVYRDVKGMDSFEPWIGRLEQLITEGVLRDEALLIPADWYAGNWPALEGLLERLFKRRARVRELIESTHNVIGSPFRNWKSATSPR
jgi:hypothetical protein